MSFSVSALFIIIFSRSFWNSLSTCRVIASPRVSVPIFPLRSLLMSRRERICTPEPFEVSLKSRVNNSCAPRWVLASTSLFVCALVKPEIVHCFLLTRDSRFLLDAATVCRRIFFSSVSKVVRPFCDAV